MSLSPSQIESVAALAQLELAREEVPLYSASLTRILDMVGQLEKADTGSIEPMAHPLAGQVQRLRPDAVTAANERERYQACAPQVEDGLYLVPKVIE